MNNIEKRQVTFEEANNFAKTNEILFYEVSAKNG
jgi:hypothetical protein